MKFRPHCPGFVNDGEAAEGPSEFTDLLTLQQAPQVARFLASGCHLQKAFTSPHDAVPVTEHLLMACRDSKCYVIGYLSPADEVWAKLDLPVWQARSKA